MSDTPYLITQSGKAGALLSALHSSVKDYRCMNRYFLLL